MFNCRWLSTGDMSEVSFAAVTDGRGGIHQDIGPLLLLMTGGEVVAPKPCLRLVTEPLAEV